MRILIDATRCQGHALCHLEDPEAFPVDENGYAVSGEREIPTGHEERARRAAIGCPERAIVLLAEEDPVRPLSPAAPGDC